jgi:hypothetical protein
MITATTNDLNDVEFVSHDVEWSGKNMSDQALG